jgi:hypothetical protein
VARPRIRKSRKLSKIVFAKERQNVQHSKIPHTPMAVKHRFVRSINLNNPMV